MANSDHHILRLEIDSRSEISGNKFLIPNCREANFEKLKHELSNSDWMNFFVDTLETEDIPGEMTRTGANSRLVWITKKTGTDS